MLTSFLRHRKAQLPTQGPRRASNSQPVVRTDDRTVSSVGLSVEPVDYGADVKIKPWRILERRVTLDRRPWFTVGTQDVELPDGTVLRDYNWIKMRSFAIVVPLLAGDRTILARSYKLGVGEISLSL